MLVSKNAKFAVPLTQIFKFALPPTQNPNASQWNIGCVGSQTQNFCVGHVHSTLFVLIPFVLVTQRNPVCSGIWALSLKLPVVYCHFMDYSIKGNMPLTEQIHYTFSPNCNFVPSM